MGMYTFYNVGKSGREEKTTIDEFLADKAEFLISITQIW
jgi:hypothetical protein